MEGVGVKIHMQWVYRFWDTNNPLLPFKFTQRFALSEKSVWVGAGVGAQFPII